MNSVDLGVIEYPHLIGFGAAPSPHERDEDDLAHFFKKMSSNICIYAEIVSLKLMRPKRNMKCYTFSFFKLSSN